MKLLSFLSDMMIPVFMLYIILWGLFAKRDVYNDFLDGAKDGLKTVAGICPALIGLLTGVGILRGSGFLDFVGNVGKKDTMMYVHISNTLYLSS